MNVEGKNPVKEALDSDKKISRLYIAKNARDLQPLIDAARSKGVRVEFVDKFYLDKISESGRHQGAIAIAEDFRYSDVDEIIAYAKSKNQRLFMIILDGIEDPHNLGSILRAAECMGAHGVVIPSRRSACVNATVLRTSAGSANHIRVAMVGNINDTIRQLRDNFVNVYAADMQGISIDKCRFDEDLAIVIGNEGSGVKPLTEKLCSGVVSIPQYGKVNSLNASVACGIICYEITRQRNS